MFAHSIQQQFVYKVYFLHATALLKIVITHKKDSLLSMLILCRNRLMNKKACFAPTVKTNANNKTEPAQ